MDWKLLRAQHSVNTAGFCSCSGITTLFSGNLTLLVSFSYKVGERKRGQGGINNILTTVPWMKCHCLQNFLIRTTALIFLKTCFPHSVFLWHTCLFSCCFFTLFANRHARRHVLEIRGISKPNFLNTCNVYQPSAECWLLTQWLSETPSHQSPSRWGAATPLGFSPRAVSRSLLAEAGETASAFLSQKGQI